MSDDLGKAIVQHLESVAEVQAEVGAGDDARIYPDGLDQGATLPAITVEVPSNTPEGSLTGAVGLAHARVRFGCYAATRGKATKLAEIIRTKGLKDGYRGALGSMTIRCASLEAGPFDDRDRPSEGSQQWRYISWMDYLVSYKQTIPA